MILDNLTAGDFIVIYRGPCVRHDFPGLYRHRTRYIEDASLVGMPLRVEAVDLPFVAARLLPMCGWPIQIIDTRTTEVRECSRDYARSMTNLCQCQGQKSVPHSPQPGVPTHASDREKT